LIKINLNQLLAGKSFLGQKSPWTNAYFKTVPSLGRPYSWTILFWTSVSWPNVSTSFPVPQMTKLELE